MDRNKGEVLRTKLPFGLVESKSISDDTEALKAYAERVLDLFVTSLGAVWPEDASGQTAEPGWLRGPGALTAEREREICSMVPEDYTAEKVPDAILDLWQEIVRLRQLVADLINKQT